MHKKRLLKLATFLREVVPARNFNLESITSYNKDSPISTIKQIVECKTTACACGWVPACFPKSGAALLEGEVVCESSNECFDFEEFFEITDEEWDYLFMPQSYPKDRRYKSYVANRIEKFVSSNGKSARRHYETYY